MLAASFQIKYKESALKISIEMAAEMEILHRNSQEDVTQLQQRSDLEKIEYEEQIP